MWSQLSTWLGSDSYLFSYNNKNTNINLEWEGGWLGRGSVSKLKFSSTIPRSQWRVSKTHLSRANALYAYYLETWRTSVVVQRLRIWLPMQGTWVQALVREDPTCRRATKPVHHNYWACALEPTSHNYWAPVPQLLKPTRLEPVLRNKRSHHKEMPVHRNEE